MWEFCVMRMLFLWAFLQSTAHRFCCQGYQLNRRRAMQQGSAAALATATIGTGSLMAPSLAVSAAEEEPALALTASGDAKKLFNEGRALESQGNMLAAQRAYSKVTKIAPQFIYGYSSLGNTQTALGDLAAADASYTTSIDLCRQNEEKTERKCPDLYVLLLNRGSLRLNNGRPKEALADLQQSSLLRGRPDAMVLQNLARAEELNGNYNQADYNYGLAIQMTANEVNPFWLRSAMVKYQLGDFKGGFDLFKRIENRFPEAPEVRAASAVFLLSNDETAARQKYLSIPDRQRLKYVDTNYLQSTIAWPPKMIESLNRISAAVGDNKAFLAAQ